ncbi:MAG: hypothetical protein JWQ35_177 [Bacteriovoracaceae bacterium]|nr:hypothetical protein [Bacteriovoracaceae bacterium]
MMATKEKMPFSAQYFLEVKMNKKIKENFSSLEGLDCSYQFEIDDDVWNLDLTKKNPQIKSGPLDEPDCAIKLSSENFEKLVRGKLNVPLDLVTGKLIIKGD